MSRRDIGTATYACPDRTSGLKTVGLVATSRWLGTSALSRSTQAEVGARPRSSSGNATSSETWYLYVEGGQGFTTWVGGWVGVLCYVLGQGSSTWGGCCATDWDRSSQPGEGPGGGGKSHVLRQGFTTGGGAGGEGHVLRQGFTTWGVCGRCATYWDRGSQPFLQLRKKKRDAHPLLSVNF